jgi:hypothetical protein
MIQEMQFVLVYPDDSSNTLILRALFLPAPPLGPPRDEFFGTFGSGLGDFRLPSELFDGVYQMLRTENPLTLSWRTNKDNHVTSFELSNDSENGAGLNPNPTHIEKT